MSKIKSILAFVAVLLCGGAWAEDIHITNSDCGVTVYGYGNYRPVSLGIAADDSLPAGTVVRVKNIRMALQESNSAKPNTISLNGVSSSTAVVGDSLGDIGYAVDYAFANDVYIKVGEEYLMTTPSDGTGRFRLYKTTETKWGAIRVQASMEAFRPYYDITAEVTSTPTDNDYSGKVIALNFNSSQGACSGDNDSGALGVALPGKGWNNFANDSAFPNNSVVEYNQALKTVSSAIDGLSVTLTRHNGGGNYQWANATTSFLKGYIDDNGEHATVAVTGIPYATYDLYVYYATDSINKDFSPAIINGKYFVWNALVHDFCSTPTAESFGYSQFKMPVLGVNVQKVSALSGDLTVTNTGSNSGSRGGIAALVIVERTDVDSMAKTEAMSIKVATRTDSWVRSAAFANDGYVGAYPVRGSYWQNTASKNSNSGAYGEYLQLTDGNGQSAKLALYVGNNWYSTAPSYANGNSRIARSNVDCNDTYNPIAQNSAKSFSNLTMNSGALDGASSIELPALSYKRNWQARITNIPYDSYDLYVIVASGDATAIFKSLGVKVGERDIKYYKGSTSGTEETTTNTDTWSVNGYTTDGDLTEGKHYLRIRVTKASADEDISTVDFAPVNGKFTLGAIQIVKAPNRVVTSSFSFNSFTIEGTTSKTTLAAGDTVIIPSNCSDDAWGCDVSTINSYATEIGKSMNWKKPVNKDMTIGSDVVVYFYTGASIESGVTISGGSVNLSNDITVNGAATVTSEVIGSYKFKLASGATLKVASELTSGKVTTNVSGKIVDYNSSTKTYSLIDPPVATVVIDGETQNFTTLAAALSAAGTAATAQNKKTVTLLLANSDTITIPANVVLDTSTYSFTGTVSGSGTIISYGSSSAAPAVPNGVTAGTWTGTVWLKNKADWININLNAYGNSDSTVRLTNISGYLTQYANVSPCVELVDEKNGDNTIEALKITNGWSNDIVTLQKIKGKGTINLSAGPVKMLIKDSSGFEGAAKVTVSGINSHIGGLIFGNVDKSTLTAGNDSPHNNKITILSGNSVEIASGKTWSATGGMIVNGTISGSGTIDTALTLENNATIDITSNSENEALTLGANRTLSIGSPVNVIGVSEGSVILNGLSASPENLQLTAVTVGGESVAGAHLYFEDGALKYSAQVAATWEPDETFIDDNGIFDWSATGAWKDTSGASATWSVTAETEPKPDVTIDATKVKGVKISGQIYVGHVTVKGELGDDESFQFHSSFYAPENEHPVDGEHEVNEEIDCLHAASVNLTELVGELGMKVPITGNIAFGRETHLVFATGTVENPSTAYGYSFVDRGGSIAVEGEGRFVVPSTMYGVPFAVGEDAAIVFNVASGEATSSAVISGAGAIVKTGEGTIKFTTANTFTGGLYVEAGEAKTTNGTGFGPNNYDNGQPMAKITVSSGATLDLANLSGTSYDITCGGTLKNSGGDLGTGTRQTPKLTMSGNVTANGNQFGLLANSWGATSLDMGGHTLTVSLNQNKNFILCNTTVTKPGLINVTANGLHLNANSATIKVDASTVSLQNNEFTFIKYPAGTSASIANIELTNNAEHNYKLSAVGNLIKICLPTAKIDVDGTTKYYANVADAASAATSGQVITPLSNATLNKAITIANGASLNIPENVTIETSANVSGTITGAGKLVLVGNGFNGAATQIMPKPTFSNWTGTVEIRDWHCARPSEGANIFEVSNYANANSSLILNGYKGYFHYQNSPYSVKSLQIIGDGLNQEGDFSGTHHIVIKAETISGTGQIVCGLGRGNSANFMLVGDVSGYTGDVTANSNYRVVFAGAENDTLPSHQNGSIAIGSTANVTLGSGTTWTTTNGIQVAGTLKLDGGAIADSKTITGSGIVKIEGDGSEVVDVPEPPLASTWTGTVELKGFVKAWTKNDAHSHGAINLNKYGNSNSKLVLEGITMTSYASGTATSDNPVYTLKEIELRGNGLTLVRGAYSVADIYNAKLTGTGKLRVSATTNNTSGQVVFKGAHDFRGNITIEHAASAHTKRVVLVAAGAATPSQSDSDYESIYVGPGVTVVASDTMTWSAPNGVKFGGTLDLTGGTPTWTGTPAFGNEVTFKLTTMPGDEAVKIMSGTYTPAENPLTLGLTIVVGEEVDRTHMLTLKADGVYIEKNNTGRIQSLIVGSGENRVLSTGETLICEAPPSLDAAGTITVDAAGLEAGAYDLVTWTGVMAKGAAGYGKPQVVIQNVPQDWEGKLVFQTTKISLLLRDPDWLARPAITIWPFGDSITEGYNGSNRANYRIQLFQKLELLGYNVKSVGWWTSNYGGQTSGCQSYDPTGTICQREDWSYHSGVRSGRVVVDNGKNNVLSDAVETGLDQAGDPDVVLLHIGTNDGDPSNANFWENIYDGITNIAWRVIAARDNTKVVLSTILPLQTGHSNYSLNTSSIEKINAKLKEAIDAKVFPEGRVYLADLHSYVPNTPENYVSDHTHPDWIGHDKMAEGWLSVVTNVFKNVEDPRVQSNIVRTVPTADHLGAAANVPAEYRSGYRRLASMTPSGTKHFALDENAYNTTETGVEGSTQLSRVAYFMELVGRETKIHRYVWVDMDAFGDTFADCGFPTANNGAKQQVVNNIHVYANTGAIANIAPSVSGKTGFIEFTPYNYGAAASSVTGAPNHQHGLDWNDTLTTSGATSGYGCFQIHAIAPEGPRPTVQPAQVLMAYNRWGKGNTGTTEIGIGNFSQFIGTVNDANVDYTYTYNKKNVKAEDYEVINIEFWGKVPGYVVPDGSEVEVEAETREAAVERLTIATLSEADTAANAGADNELGQAQYLTLQATRVGESNSWKVQAVVDNTKLPENKKIDDTAVAFANAGGIMKLAGATEKQTISIPKDKATAGLYYSVSFGTSPDNHTQESERVLATSGEGTVDIPVPALGNEKVYYIKVKASATK